MILNEDLPNLVEWQKKVDNAPGDEKADVIEDYIRSRFNMGDPNTYNKVKDIILILVEYIQDNNDKLSDYDNPILVFVDNYIKINKDSELNVDVLDTINKCLEDRTLTSNDINNTKNIIYYPSLYKNNPDPEKAAYVVKIGPWLKNNHNPKYVELLKEKNIDSKTLLFDEKNEVRNFTDIKKTLQEIQLAANDKGVSLTTETRYKEFEDNDLNKMSKEDITKSLKDMNRDTLIKLIKDNLLPKVK